VSTFPGNPQAAADFGERAGPCLDGGYGKHRELPRLRESIEDVPPYWLRSSQARCATKHSKVGANMPSLLAPSSGVWRALLQVDGTSGDAGLRSATGLG
jgi:hypothetical protein